MKNVCKPSLPTSGLAWRKFTRTFSGLATLLAILAAGLLSSFVGSDFAENNCPQPSNFVTSGKGSNSITLSWAPASGVGNYSLKYMRQGSSLTSQLFSTATTSFTFTGLAAGTYSFYLASDCGGELSGYIVTDDIIND